MTAARPAPIRSRSRLRRLACGPLEPAADGAWLLRGGLTRTMNVYLVRDEQAGGVVVFDAGEKGMAGPIAAAASALGGISRVVLGHGDTDHRGAAPALRALAEVQCHPDAVERAQGSGGRDYWRTKEFPRDVRLLHGFAPVRVGRRARPHRRHGAGGRRRRRVEVVELAGHAPGLIGLWRERDGVALVSDCIYMTDMHGKPQPPAVPIDAYNLHGAGARVRAQARRPAAEGRLARPPRPAHRPGRRRVARARRAV